MRVLIAIDNDMYPIVDVEITSNGNPVYLIDAVLSTKNSQIKLRGGRWDHYGSIISSVTGHMRNIIVEYKVGVYNR